MPLLKGGSVDMEGHGKGSSRLRGIFERWVGFVQRRAPAVIIIAVLLTAGVLFYSLRNFRINTDINSMISEKLRFRVLEKDFSRAFPQFTDTLVVVLDADTPERAFSARAQLAERLRKETALFKTVYEPGGGEFFEKNGLLYLDAKELNEFADKMAGAQPLLALLSRDLSLRGLFSVLETAMSRPEFKEMQGTTVDQLFSGMSRTFDGVASHRPRRMSWEELMLGVKEADEQRNQFIVLQPFLDETGLSGGEVPIERIRLIAKELSLDEAHGVKVRITGDVALSHETLAEVRKSTGVATIVSLVLVAALLFFGLGRSLRLVVAGLATLLIGLIWTTGFALAAVGSLNMISITFAVLFIGLGIDYSIQFCLRYRELIRSGHEHNESVRTTAKGVGRSLLLSAITTAIGFYSFVPTAYAGVAELGIISGTGMFISFFANLTVLPALLALLPIKDKQATPSEGSRLIAFPYTHSRAVIIAAAILGLGSAALAPRLRFDYNPLNLYDPRSESVIAIRELFKGAESMPWTSSVLVRGAKEAKVKAEKLRK
ncbi:MAG TPA: MMPL family transporter, partial [Dissulfurispiraceae bacterium]